MSYNSKLFAIVIPAIAALAISTQSAFAKVEAVGMYDGTCEEFTALIDAGDDQSRDVAAAVVSWIEGYLSGLNAMNSESIDLEPQGWDGEVRVQVIMGFCRETPEATMEQVAITYYLTMVDSQDTPIS